MIKYFPFLASPHPKRFADIVCTGSYSDILTALFVVATYPIIKALQRHTHNRIPSGILNYRKLSMCVPPCLKEIISILKEALLYGDEDRILHNWITIIFSMSVIFTLLPWKSIIREFYSDVSGIEISTTCVGN